MRVLFLKDHNWYPADFDPDARRATVLDWMDEDEDVTQRYLIPGLVDSHCHGVEGMDVMDGDAEKIGKNLRKLGIEYYCPTTITAPWSDIRAAIEPCRKGFPGFAGVHLEGPFINPGRAGAQPRDHISPPNLNALQDELGELSSLVKIVTLAPEMEGSASLINQLRQRGIAVSAGHTDASYMELSELRIERMTHFYNAMRPFHHRDPGAVGYGLLKDVIVEVIYDKIHVSQEAIEILLRTRPDDANILAVSDGTRLSGMRSGTQLEMWGHAVRKENDAVRCSDGTLAGSAVTLAEVFRNMWQDFSPYLAVKTCSENPRKHLGLPPPKLWLLVDAEGTIIQVFEMDLDIA